MQNQQDQASVDVIVKSFTKMFNDAKFPLAIDTYQRGFVWGEDKIVQLIQDLEAYAKIEGVKPPYYIGTILIHQQDEKEKFFIIDGQQRLTALSILHHQLKGSLPQRCEMKYSPSSAKNIKRTSELLPTLLNGTSKLSAGIFDHIHLTLITVDSVDLAFTFFDTQNNRGVPLHGTDLLKAYHLRAIDGDARERLQTLCAERWEDVQGSDSILCADEDFVPTLFNKFLWRSRTWLGTQVRFENHDALMREFQQNSYPIDGKNETLPLYRARSNRLGKAITLKEEGYSEITTCPIALGNDSADLPFALRQPVHQGVGFFLYTDKYSGLLQRLMLTPTTSPEIRAFRDLYEHIVKTNSLFLKEAYLLAGLMYFDQFGAERIFEFGLWLDHGLGSIRMEKQSVYMAAAKNYFNYSGERTFNLLDVISNAFLPDEVIKKLSGDPISNSIYKNEKAKAGERVQGRYKQAVLTYYGQDGDLANRDSWINASLINAKLKESNS